MSCYTNTVSLYLNFCFSVAVWRASNKCNNTILDLSAYRKRCLITSVLKVWSENIFTTPTHNTSSLHAYWTISRYKKWNIHSCINYSKLKKNKQCSESDHDTQYKHLYYVCRIHYGEQLAFFNDGIIEDIGANVNRYFTPSSIVCTAPFNQNVCSFCTYIWLWFYCLWPHIHFQLFHYSL